MFDLLELLGKYLFSQAENRKTTFILVNYNKNHFPILLEKTYHSRKPYAERCAKRLG